METHIYIMWLLQKGVYSHSLLKIKSAHVYLGHTAHRPVLGTGIYLFFSRNYNFNLTAPIVYIKSFLFLQQKWHLQHTQHWPKLSLLSINLFSNSIQKGWSLFGYDVVISFIMCYYPILGLHRKSIYLFCNIPIGEQEYYLANLFLKHMHPFCLLCRHSCINKFNNVRKRTNI